MRIRQGGSNLELLSFITIPDLTPLRLATAYQH